MYMIQSLYPLLLEADLLKDRLVAGVIALLVALLIAWMVTGAWKSKLKSVRKEDYARHYIRKDSLVIHKQSDVFTHKHVDRTARPKKEG